MNSALASLIAVAGTLLGSLITYIFQRRTADRTENFAWRRLLRAERLSAYSDFAGAVVAYRQSQYEPFHRRLEEDDSPALVAAKSESYRRRMAAQQALFQVQLVTVGPDLVQLAERALETTKGMLEATTTTELKDWTRRAKQALDEFVRTAGERIRA
jgi:hypothetical protein